MKNALPFLGAVALLVIPWSQARGLDQWETTYGINLSDPGKAMADWDQDGLTSQQEHDLGTNPWGVWRVVCVSDHLGNLVKMSYGTAVNASGEVFGNGYFQTGSTPQSQVPAAWYWKEGSPPVIAEPFTYVCDASASGIAVGHKSP